MPKDITSPFTPGSPVSVEFFVGREKEISHLRSRVKRSLSGRVEVVFLTGERGIGKSSLAAFVRHLCEQDLAVFGIHVFLGGINTLHDMARRVFDELAKVTYGRGLFEKVKSLFGDGIKSVGLFNITVEFDAPKKDLMAIVNNFGDALDGVRKKLEDKKGILLIIDDINGLARSNEFANWLKSFVDSTAVSKKHLPLCILFVGYEEYRQTLISSQPSLARIIDPVHIDVWSDEETENFFVRAFKEVDVRVDDSALGRLVTYASGLPVLAHEIGYAAFNADVDGRIDQSDAIRALIDAAEIVGRKYLEPQVLSLIRSERYLSMLRSIAGVPFLETFKRSDIIRGLDAKDKRIFDNFLRRMEELGVLVNLKKGSGLYRFSNKLNRLYINLLVAREEHSREE